MNALRGAAGRLRRLWAGVPLRARLVLAVMTLAALALTLTGAAGTRALHAYLLTRVDARLEQTAHGWVDGFTTGRPPPGPGGPGFGRRDPYGRPEPSGFFIKVAFTRGQSGQQLDVPDGSGQTGPDLPALDAEAVAARDGQPFTVGATGAGYDWRVVVAALPGEAGTVTVAQSLDDVSETTARLARINTIVSVGVLVLLGAAASIVVRSSLRRLVEVETTAEAIAAGDLTRRVPGADERTEVGRLASALNTMLARIEAAFAAQRASEASARASEERMRRFVADASHELRTPLTSIRGFAELYRQGAVPDEDALAEVMDRIEGEATRMGLLVDDLLLLARLDQQRPLERQPVDLLPLAASAVGDARVLAPDHPTRLEIQGGDGTPPPVVLGDEDRLRQVVGNLVANAWRHTPAGTTVTVRLGSADGAAVLEVIDDGPGFAPEAAAKAFERFYRADAGRARQPGATGGTGLGLSIVAALVAAHGGSVDLRNDPGAGAHFTVKLPLHAAPEPAPAPAS